MDDERRDWARRDKARGQDRPGQTTTGQDRTGQKLQDLCSCQMSRTSSEASLRSYMCLGTVGIEARSGPSTFGRPMHLSGFVVHFQLPVAGCR